MPNKIIQQFDWEDRLAHYGKIITNIALIIVVVLGVSKIASILDRNSAANIAEQQQNDVGYTNLGDGSAQSDTQVVSKKEIQEMLDEFGKSIQQQLKKTNSEITEVHRLVASGTSTHSAQPSTSTEMENGSMVYQTPWDRNDKSKEYWASFTLPDKEFDVDNHIKVSMSLIKAIQIDDKTIRFMAEVTNDYTGEKLDQIQQFDSSLDRLEFRKGLDLPEWSLVTGASIRSDGVGKLKLGVQRGHWVFYGAKYTDQVFEVGVDRTFNLSKWWR